MSRVGSQIAECLTVTKNYGAPFKPLATRPLSGRISRYAHIPQVAAIHIATIRIKEDRALVGRERPLFYFATSGGKEIRRSSGGGQGIQMLPTVFLGSDDELIAGGPIDYAAAGILRHVRKRSLRRHAAVPYFLGRRCGGFCHPDSPRMRFVRSNEEALGRVSRLRG